MHKRSLIVCLILLLLIGGGGTAFYLHLRTQKTTPPFSAVDEFVARYPDSTGAPGPLEYRTNEEAILTPESKWLRKLGIRRHRPLHYKVYQFTVMSVPQREWLLVLLSEDKQRLHRVVVQGAPADTKEIKRALLEKFPDLRHILIVQP